MIEAVTVNNRIRTVDWRTWRPWLVLLIALVIVVAVIGVANGRAAVFGVGQNTLSRAQSSGMLQTSEGGQVTVAATWQGPTAGLVFRVALDTHSVDLGGYDLRELAVLRTDQGREVRPSS